MDNWVIIIIVTAIIGGLVGAFFAVGTWFVNRLISGVDAKFDELGDKIVNNTTKLFEAAEVKGNRITRLEAIEEIRRSLK